VLRRRFQDPQLIALAIAAPTLPALIGILGVSRALLLVIAALIGASTTLGRHSFDSLLQHRAPVALRGRAASQFETRFQLVWAVGGVLATPISFPAEASMAVLTALYVPALVVYLRASRGARLFEERSVDVFGRAERRLVSAEQSLSRDELRLAIVDAAAAVDLARLADVVTTNGAVDDLEHLRARAVDVTTDVGPDDARQAVELARSLLTLGRSRSRT
jgi:hypothetical protein